ITPDARLRCRPKTRSVAFPCALSTGPYPVTSTCTTVGDTRLTSAAIESLYCRNGLSVCDSSARADSAGARRTHAAARHHRGVRSTKSEVRRLNDLGALISQTSDFVLSLRELWPVRRCGRC